MTPEEIEAVAKKLTKAQQKLLAYHPFWGFSKFNTVKALRSRGLLVGADITPLGLAVRAHLQSQGTQP